MEHRFMFAGAMPSTSMMIGGRNGLYIQMDSLSGRLKASGTSFWNELGLARPSHGVVAVRRGSGPSSVREGDGGLRGGSGTMKTVVLLGVPNVWSIL